MDKEENCRVPMQDECRYCMSSTDTAQPKPKIILAAGGLLFMTMCVMIVIVFQSLSEIRHLNQELEQLKSSVAELTTLLGEPQYDDLISTDATETSPKASNEIDYDFENYDDYIDNEIYEDDNDVTPNDIGLSDDNIQKLLTGGRFTKDKKTDYSTGRKRRSVVGYTEDGVPINSESYAEARRKNMTRQPPATTPINSPYSLAPKGRLQEMGVWITTPTPRPVYARRSRVMHQEDKSKAFRQVVKKSSILKSADLHRNLEEEDMFTVVTDSQIGGKGRHRHTEDFDERRPRIGRMRPLPSAHYSGDTSKYVMGTHTNFLGNGHLSHPKRTYVDWAESRWVGALGMNRHYSMDDGVLTVKESGLYFVYAQIYYLDEHDSNGYRVYRNEETLLQCTTRMNSVVKETKGSTCYTAAAEYLGEGDQVRVGDLADGRYSLFEPGKSFFGIIKIGDIKIK